LTTVDAGAYLRDPSARHDPTRHGLVSGRVPSAQFMMNKFRAVRDREKLRRIRLRSRNKSVVADASDRTGIAIFAEHSTAPKGPTIILCVA
jgi:hypothetical protein